MSVGSLRRLFGVSRQAFYRKEQYVQRARGQSLLVLDLVLVLWREIPGLGTRKLHMLLHQPLAESGIKMGRDKLHHLLHEHGLLLRRARQVPQTTNSLHSLRKYPIPFRLIKVSFRAKRRISPELIGTTAELQ